MFLRYYSHRLGRTFTIVCNSRTRLKDYLYSPGRVVRLARIFFYQMSGIEVRPKEIGHISYFLVYPISLLCLSDRF